MLQVNPVEEQDFDNSSMLQKMKEPLIISSNDADDDDATVVKIGRKEYRCTFESDEWCSAGSDHNADFARDLRRAMSFDKGFEKTEKHLDEIEKINTISTRMANERTFLAWVRTAFSLVSFGIILLKLDTDPITQSVGCLMELVGISCFFIGSHQYDVFQTIIDTNKLSKNSFKKSHLKRYGWLLFLLVLGTMAFYVYKSNTDTSNKSNDWRLKKIH